MSTARAHSTLKIAQLNFIIPFKPTVARRFRTTSHYSKNSSRVKEFRRGTFFKFLSVKTDRVVNGRIHATMRSIAAHCGDVYFYNV